MSIGIFNKYRAAWFQVFENRQEIRENLGKNVKIYDYPNEVYEFQDKIRAGDYIAFSCFDGHIAEVLSARKTIRYYALKNRNLYVFDGLIRYVNRVHRLDRLQGNHRFLAYRLNTSLGRIDCSNKIMDDFRKIKTSYYHLIASRSFKRSIYYSTATELLNEKGRSQSYILEVKQLRALLEPLAKKYMGYFITDLDEGADKVLAEMKKRFPNSRFRGIDHKFVKLYAMEYMSQELRRAGISPEYIAKKLMEILDGDELKAKEKMDYLFRLEELTRNHPTLRNGSEFRESSSFLGTGQDDGFQLDKPKALGDGNHQLQVQES